MMIERVSRAAEGQRCQKYGNLLFQQWNEEIKALQRKIQKQ